MPAREPRLDEPRGTLMIRTGVDPQPQIIAVMGGPYALGLDAITVMLFQHNYHNPDYLMYANRFRVVEDEDAAR